MSERPAITVLVVATLVATLGCAAVSGAGHRDRESPRSFGLGAQALVDAVFRFSAPFDAAVIADHHVHVFGLGLDVPRCANVDVTDIRYNHGLLSWFRLLQQLMTFLFSRTGGITDLYRADEQYVGSLLRQVSESRRAASTSWLSTHIATTPVFRTGAVPTSTCRTNTSWRSLRASICTSAAIVSRRWGPCTLAGRMRRSGFALSADPACGIKWLPPAMNIDPLDAPLAVFQPDGRAGDDAAESHRA